MRHSLKYSLAHSLFGLVSLLYFSSLLCYRFVQRTFESTLLNSVLFSAKLGSVLFSLVKVIISPINFSARQLVKS